MRDFKTISIQEISKSDMIMILNALDWTGREKNLPEYTKLKDDIISELAELAELEEEDLINILKK